MNVIRFLRSDNSANWNMILFMSALSGIAGGAILAIVNSAASIEGADAAEDASKTQPMFLFLVAILIYIYAKRNSVFRATAIVESLVTDLRLRVCDKLRRSDLEVVEGLDKSETFTTITKDANLIAQAGFIVTSAAQQAVMLVVGMAYLAWLSTAAFVLFAVGASIGGWLFLGHRDSLAKMVRKDTEKQSELFAYLSHLLYGFKEVKLHDEKSDELYADLSRVASESREVRQGANMFYVSTALFADITLYLLLGTIIFILPQMIPTYSDVLVKATVAVMFVFGPLSSVVGSMPQFTNAEAALTNIFRLEARLDETLQAAQTPAEAAAAPSFADFQSIALQGVNFSYAESDGLDSFSVGPVDLQIERGEILFIVGGNGSGKTTLLKLITGLYEPRIGALLVDGRRIGRPLLPAYRKLFAGVFSDFHLFGRLYGTGAIDQERAQALLERMQISEKVRIVEGRFSTQDLSTGQRKRLALIASLLEDRPVYLFDEWTADQDPNFREHFYSSLLPELKQQGKTVIAITHDDRYWGAADRVVKMDYGKIVAIDT